MQWLLADRKESKYSNTLKDKNTYQTILDTILDIKLNFMSDIIAVARWNSNSFSFFIFYHYVQVMLQHNEGLLTKQERCKHFIIRQLEVSGRDTTEEEVNEMVDTGKWEVFNENLLNDARITRSQLSEIEQRHKVRIVVDLLDMIYCWESLSLSLGSCNLSKKVLNMEINQTTFSARSQLKYLIQAKQPSYNCSS